jgi:hypothetical protein
MGPMRFLCAKSLSYNYFENTDMYIKNYRVELDTRNRAAVCNNS